MATINPYLTFNGNCEAAFLFYKSIFGGEFPFMGRFKDMPSENPMPESDKERIMHVSLPIGSAILMGSDVPSAEAHRAIAGSNFTISITAESEDEANNLFNGLSVGGSVMMPMQKSFWGAYFGMLTDKFGISWMVNYDYKA